MSFDFDKEDLARYFIDNHRCWYCGKNTVSAFHHIHPRSDTARCSSSMFNVAHLCNYPCHLNNHGVLVTEEWRKKFLQRTAKYLFAQNIILKDVDKDFLTNNAKYYE